MCLFLTDPSYSDIVDHKSQNDSIWEILIGAVLTENDDKGQYQ